MITRLIAFSLQNRAFVFFGALLLAAVGVFCAMRLPVDAVPDITGVQVQINTEVPALAPDEIEKLVSQPLERSLAGLHGVEEMRSLSKVGLSQITLQFSDDTEIYRARQMVAERLQNVAEELPNGLTPKLAPVSTGLGEIFYYVLDYKADAPHKPATREAQLFELSDLHEYVVKPMFRTVQGLAEVNTNGGYEKQIEIHPRPADLEQINMTVAEFAEIVGRNVQNAGGGVFSREDEWLNIRAVTRAGTLEEIQAIPLKFGGGVEPVRVRDVAEVTSGAKFRTGAATLDGHEVVLGTTMMLAGENSRVVAERVKARLAEVQEKLPEGVEIRAVYDRSILVDHTIHTVQKNLIEGAALVIVVLFLLLGNWRAALIVACVIPLAFLFAITGMVRGGISGNLMSLGAVDFGLIIDGAVVIVENIVRELGLRRQKEGRRLTRAERDEVVLSASSQVAHPMFFGVLIITLVYVPILSLSGIEGKMFHPMALTVMLALSGSLLLSLTLMPALCAVVLTGEGGPKENFLMRLAQWIYRPLLSLFLKLRWLLLPAAAALCWGAFLIYQSLGAEFVPKLDEGSMTVMLYKKVGMSMEASLASDLAVEKAILAKVPEITRIFSRIGSSEVATDPMPVNESDVYLFYKPEHEWRKKDGRPMTKDELIHEIEATVTEAVPDTTLLFAQPIEMRFNELLEGIRSDVAVKIFGNDYDVLDPISEQVKEILEKTPGVSEAEFETNGRTTSLEIVAKRDALVRYNLQADELNRAVRTALGGETVGVLHEGNFRRHIVVRLDEKRKGDVEQMKQLQLRVGEHGVVPLGEVADFRTVKAVEPINHDEGRRRNAIMVNVRGRDVESCVLDAKQRIESEVKLPPGYSIEFGGQFENLQEARTRLMLVVPAALALILALIFFAFGSIRQTLIVATGIPLALTGGALALWLRGMPFSITAAVGFIALSGVAVLNGLVLIEYFNHLRQKGRTLELAVSEGALTRLRPVLMTALVASLGFVPMAIATGSGAEVQKPLATVVIGGILSSTLLTLLFLPGLYVLVEKRALRNTEAVPEGALPEGGG